MAYSTLSKPGTEHGPCAQPCEHRDCAATRSMAEVLCFLCKDAIGYERNFVTVEAKLAHRVCYVESRDKQVWP